MDSPSPPAGAVTSVRQMGSSLPQPPVPFLAGVTVPAISFCEQHPSQVSETQEVCLLV